MSCRKTPEEDKLSVNDKQSLTLERNPDLNCDLSSNICEDCSFQEQTSEDEEDDRSTILGGVINNPYSITSMTAAYNYIYSSNISNIPATHKYIRFKPANVHQLAILDSLDLELYDHPLNRHVIQDGDYWPEASTGLAQNELPWFYTVVDLWFNFPPGIQVEILEELHIPDINADLEDEAYYITGNSVCDSSTYATRREDIKEYYTTVANDYVPCVLQRMEEKVNARCGGGGGGGGTPPSPIPSGMINFKTYTTSLGGKSSEMMTEGIGASAPLKYARVVGRRFFKIDKTYTDQNGNFQFSKRFPRKVTLIVKFKASAAHQGHSVRMNYKNFGFWRSMFPLKKNIGTYKGNSLQNLNYQFEKGSGSTKRKTRLWIAAVMMNTIQESRMFLSENNMISLPHGLRFYLYTPGEQNNLPQFDFLKRSNTPWLNQDRTTFNDIFDYGGTSIIGGAVVFCAFSGAGALAAALAITFISSIPHRPDVYFHYRTSDINSLTATKVSISTGQQLGIGYISNLIENNTAPGASRETYVSSRAHATEQYTFDTYAPFGNNTANPPSLFYTYKPEVIAIWESFAQHFGHTIADRIYGNGAETFELQGKQWASTFGNSSNLKYLEEFDPQIGVPSDYFSWIPVGLINDLMDNQVDPLPMNDNVSGFTYQEIQSVLAQKLSLMAQVKSLLKDIKPSQSTQIDQLFASYGY